MKDRLAISAILIIILSITNACKHTSEPVESYKNPFEMTWKCDTLMYTNSAQTMLQGFYVNSTTSIWAYGHSDVSRGQLWKYDGSSWNPYPIFNDISSSTLGFSRIIGFGPDNIWLVGQRNYWDYQDKRSNKPLVIYYNGFKWNEITVNINNFDKGIYAICGNSSAELWMGSEKGYLVRYTGGQWSQDTLKLKIPTTTNAAIRDMVMYNNKPFILLTQNDGVLGFIKAHYFTGSYKNWTLLDSTVVDQTHYYFTGGNEGLYVSKTGRLYSFGDNGVWEWLNSKWQQVLSGYFTTGGMFGVGDNYIFAVGSDSYFYDGVKWKKLDFLESHNSDQIYYTNVWADGKEVFITGFSTGGFPNKTFMWHGK